MNKHILINYKEQQQLKNKAGSYIIYIEKDGQKFSYHGITNDIFKRLGTHLSKIKTTLWDYEKFNYAINTYNLLFKEAFYQKILMFLIVNNINLDKVYFDYILEGDNISDEYKKIKNSSSDIFGFNGLAFHTVKLMEMQEKSKKTIKKIISDEKERALANLDDILPHNAWAIRMFYAKDWELTAGQKMKLWSDWTKYCQKVCLNFIEWIKNNEDFLLGRKVKKANFSQEVSEQLGYMQNLQQKLQTKEGKAYLKKQSELNW